MSDEHYYKVGGSLEYQHPTYVVRQADCDLYEGLKNGEFCYVLNSRQMGKSSLRVQMMKKLKEQGIKCASIDMTRIGSHVTPSEWYAGVISELLRGFGLSRKVNFSSWWRDRELLPPLQRLRELIEDVLLAEFPEKLVIFIDEIDSIIKIKFKEDFFAFIRACYNQRVDNPDYKRLTFCLLGVATPSDLIEDRNVSTPFNIGRAIELTGFQLHEAAPLAQGLSQKTPYPQAVLQEVLTWTGGQPFLTQKVCKLILSTSEEIPAGDEAKWVEQLVRSQIIENWETQDEPEHLRTIRDRILWSQRKGQLLLLYQQILQTSLTAPYQGGDGGVKVSDKPEHMELRLSGLVVKQQGKLRIYNRIYGCIFDRSWVENALVEAGLEPEVVAETLAPSKAEIQSLEQAALEAVQQFESQQIEALLLAMQAGQALKALVTDSTQMPDYPTLMPMYALQKILDNVHERNWFIGHQRGVTSVSFSPDGHSLVTAGMDRIVKLWDVSSSQIVQQLHHRGTIYSVSFSPNGKQVATVGAGSMIHIWDLSTSQLVKWKSDQCGVIGASFSSDGQCLVTAGWDGTVRLWDLYLLGQQPIQWSCHEGRILSLSFSPDGKQFVTAGEDRTVRLWNLFGQELAQLKGYQGRVLSLSFSPDGKQIAMAGGDGTVGLWDLSGQELAQLKGHQGGVDSVSFSPDGQRIVTGGEDGTVRFWNLTGNQLAELKGHLLGVTSVRFSPDGQRLATAGWDGTIRIWDLSEKHLAHWHSNSLTVRSVSFSPDGQLLATAGADSTVRLWNLQGKQLKQFNGHEGRVRKVSFSPDAQWLATVGDDDTVRLWNLQGQQIVLNGYQGKVNSVSFSPDGQRLATAGDDGTIRLWNLKGKLLSQLSNHLCKIKVVSFSPDGQCLATAGVNGIVKLWNLEGKLLSEFKSHRSWIYSMSFSPDGKRLAIGGTYGTLCLWGLSGNELAQWQSHQGTVYCLSFHPKGQQIATAGADGMAKLWDLSGRQLGQWQSPNNSVYSVVSFSPDGYCLATVGTGGLQIWRIGGLDELLARGYDWLKDYFITHPEAREKLDGRKNSIKSVDAERNLAQLDDSEGASTDGIPDRNVQVQKVLPSLLDSAPNAEVRKLAAETLVGVLGEMLARQGDIEKAIAAYAEAQKLDPTIEIPATIGNNLCWWGSLWGHATEVMDACETAVALDPENAIFRDSRGLARALTGNIAGAIEDFQAFVTSTDNERKRLQRQRWIEALRTGNNPFTEEEIESLLNEYNVAAPEGLKEVEVCQDQLNSVEEDRNILEVDEVDGEMSTSPSSAPVVTEQLSSECGIDYTRLHDFLVAGQWKLADRETTTIMLKIAGREVEGWLREEDIKNFPCTDLLTIDQLWTKYSQGRFGFSVQKEIWQRLGGTKNADYTIYRKFSKDVGWSDQFNSWLYSSDLTFNTTAPVGHLPGGLLDWLWSSYRESRLNLLSRDRQPQLSLGNEATDRYAIHVWWNILSSFPSRLEECKLHSPASTTVAWQHLVTTITDESEEGFLGKFLIHDKLVRIYQGDITDLVADVIVSSDDTYLPMNGGVSRRIQEVGGEEICWETRNLIPSSLGNIAVTTAGKLPAKKIFHGVVIDWPNEILPSPRIIQKVVHTCLETANQYGFSSIAFPLLGTGAGRFPVQEAWESMLKQIVKDLSYGNQNVREVIIALYDKKYGGKVSQAVNVKDFLERIEKLGWRTLL